MDSPTHIDVRSTLGYLFIGISISCILFGVIVVQTYIYYTRFPNDKLYLKIIVFVVSASELGHCVCLCHNIYVMLVNGYGNPAFILTPPKSLGASLAFSGIIGPVVQIFFAERVRIVSGKPYISRLCWILSVIRGVMTFIAMVKAVDMVTLPQYETNWKWLLSAVLASGLLIDTIIAGSLSYYLKGGEKRVTSNLDTIIAWFVQTGLLTSANGLAILVTFLASPHTFIWLGFFSLLARMFACSLLASLNGRTINTQRTPLSRSKNIQRQPSRLLNLENLSLEGSVHDNGKMTGIAESI